MKRWCMLASVFVLLAVSLSMAQPPRPENVKRLIDDLDSPVFRIREKAQAELVRLGEDIVPMLREALKKPASLEASRRLRAVLALYPPEEIEAHSNGWHWVYSSIVHAQTFEATAVTIKSLQLRVAQLNANRPAAPLEVEVRDPSFKTIYVRGIIDPEVLQREFRWQPVVLKHVAPLKPRGKYVLLFHSRDSKNTGPWVVNAIYQDVYPQGHHWYTPHEDFFFAIKYQGGKSLRVGPKGEETTARVPISSGAHGGDVGGGPLQLQSYGPIPEGRLQAPPVKKP
ncbi:MAG TPA: hypothetical protein VEL76_41125 [Gemmataceae bacterium]|nr:hypothetical protein [Gemmataceae bacterium]